MSTSRAHQRIPAYALIIAISGHGLVAPESDALRLRTTFIQFGFPTDQVDLLLGAHATRHAIIDRLRHGMKQRIAVPGLQGGIEAECILPSDSLVPQSRIPPIPDITISALLGEIARAKGDYITLLLDCCHSGSGSRDSIIDKSQDALPKDLNFESEDFTNEDGDIWSEFLGANGETDTGLNSRSISTVNPGSLRYQGIKSHVLIASCRENEKSFEFSKGRPPTSSGLFTASLLEALDDCRISKTIWSLTYVGLFTRIKDFMSDIGEGKYQQTPQCEGYHRERHVFATPLFPHRGHAIAPITKIARSPGQYHIPVGELAGVRPESEFEIYDYSKGEPVRKGRFQVSGLDNTGGSTAVINTRNDLKLSPDAYAVLCILPSPLPIDLSPDLHQLWTSQEFQSDLARRLNSRYPISHFITPVRHGSPSTLRISRSTSTGSVKIEPTNGRSRPILFPHLRIPLLSDTLAKAVMFYYHLDHQVISRQSNPLVFQALQLIEPAPNDPNYLGVLVEHPRQPPIAFRPNQETHIYHSESQFGLRIDNHERQALYIYVFYFNPNDYSITSIYLPPTDLPSLGPSGSLTIGYGNSGAAPVTFTIERHLDVDPGFFKIYYSVHPSEMSTIEQDGVDPNQLGDPRPGAPYYEPSTPLFGSVLYPMAVLNPRSRR